MNSVLLQKVLAGFLTFAQGVSDFAKAEIPLYVKELLTYCYLKHMVDAWMSLGFGVLMFVCVIVATVIFYHAFWKKNNLGHFFHSKGAETLTSGTVGSFFVSLLFILIMWVLVGGCLCFDSFTFSKNQFMLAYKAKSAPRVYVIDYLRENMPQKEAK